MTWNDAMIRKYYDAVVKHGGKNMIKKIAEDLGVEEAEVQKEASKLEKATKRKKDWSNPNAKKQKHDCLARARSSEHRPRSKPA
ncbi:unnamed protein product [Microthlaspi erraticum]|uniref:Uncharacterized protein n=1 Tax=Microthlaspi erraticum TaxID=1685480 RepID=A0A6D2KF65_9BRAS|nr:unnamed protein product [Microthlaspi erraticum]CAA7053124.1 unnamed protein product [Microthlaspi erraticum]